MAHLVAALSGGVDSAVAAALAVEAGHEVTAVHLALSRNPAACRTGSRGCCSLEDANDARRVADMLGLPFYVWDFADEFYSDVVENFLCQYSRGRTPNPCLRCNEKIKFAAFAARAMGLGFDGVVTGHYARLVVTADGVTELHRGVDPAKDQSYVLGVLTQEQLRYSCFPLGGLLKEDVRRMAAERGLRVADKPDSYDICFIPDGDTAGWLHSQLGYRPGEIRDESGTVVGHHDGAFIHTIGQRKGLHLGNPARDGRPRYVLRLDAVNNTVTVGPHEHLRVTSVRGVEPTWCQRPDAGALEALVQIRAHSEPVEATVQVDPAGVDIAFHSPVYGVAPGQTAVIFQGTRVVGSATINSTNAP